MDNINIIAKPHISPITWETFVKEYPNNSIALDGFVIGETNFDANKKMANFNHHENVNRLATRSTSAQILISLRLKLIDLYRDEKGNINVNIYVNDCDEDVCTACFLLKYSYMSELVTNPNINRLVNMEDALDTTSGTYPFPKNSKILSEMAWVFEPYRKARKFGLLANKEEELYKSIITDVENRIMQYITGRGQTIELDTMYNVIGGGKGWALVEEIGEYARTGMMSDGINAFVSVKYLKDNKYQYVIGKISPFVSFPVEYIFQTLNNKEQCTTDLWGGGDIIGGSPRVSGSSLLPKEIEEIINNLL